VGVAVLTIALSPSGGAVAYADLDGDVHLWDLTSGDRSDLTSGVKTLAPRPRDEAGWGWGGGWGAV